MNEPNRAVPPASTAPRIANSPASFPPTGPSWFRRTLRGAHAPWWVAGVALLFALPSIAVGFYADDYTLFAYLKQVFPDCPPWYNLYGFIPGDLETHHTYVKQGFLTWWTAPDLRIQLLRPLSSALFSADRALFGDHSFFYHLHSLAWFGLLLWTLWSLYRRWFSREVAALALLVYGVSSANFHLYGWISARHVLLSVAFVALALLCQERADEEDSRFLRALSWLMLMLALLAGESGLSGLVFATARAWSRASEEPQGKPARAALPFIGAALAYLAIYAALGGGARSSGLYLSPLASPLAYARAALVRVPALVGNALLSVPADFINVVPPASIVVLGLVALALFTWLASRVWSSLTASEASTLTWLSVAGLVSLPAMVGGSPGSRMLAIPNIGLAPLCAAVLLHSARAFADAGRAQAIVGRALTILFAFSTLVLGPLQLLVGVNMHLTMAQNTMFAALNLPARALRADTRMVMIASSDPMAYMYTRNVLGALGQTQASCWSLLSGAHADHEVTRTAARELTVEPVGRSMLQGEFERMYRAPWLPFEVGQVVEQCGLQIRVAALEEGRPKKIQVRFDRDLDDPSLTLVEWDTDRFVPFVPPALGKRALLKWSPGPTGLF